MSWPKVRLGEVCEIEMGQSPDSASYSTCRSIGSLPFYQGNADFGDEFPTPRVWCVAPKKLARKGDILISVRAPIGALNFSTETCCIGPGLASLSPKDECDARFLFWLLKSRTKELDEKGTGTTFKCIGRKVLDGVLFDLPPVSQQRKIATSVDKAMKRVDAIERQFEKLRETTAACFKAELKATFDSIAWDVRLSDQCEVITDGDHLPPPKTSFGIPFLVISDVADGRLSFENTRFVPREYFDKIQASRKPRSGDVLLTVTGSYGIPVEVDVDREFCFQLHIALVRSSKFLPRFLVYLFLSPKSKRYFEHVATGAAQKTVSLSNLRSMNVCCPSVADQRRLVAHLDAAKARCDGISALAARGLANCARMRKAILAEAFAV